MLRAIIAIAAGLFFSVSSAFAHKVAHPAPAATQESNAPKICLFSVGGRAVAPSVREPAVTAEEEGGDHNSGAPVGGTGSQKSPQGPREGTPHQSADNTAAGAPPMDQPPAKSDRVCGVDVAPAIPTPLG